MTSAAVNSWLVLGETLKCCWCYLAVFKTSRTCKQFLAFVFYPAVIPDGWDVPSYWADPTCLALCNISLFPFCAVELALFSARAHHTLSACDKPCVMWCCDQWLLCFVGCLLSPNEHHAALFCIGLLPVASKHFFYLSFPYKQSLFLFFVPFLILLSVFTVW